MCICDFHAESVSRGGIALMKGYKALDGGFEKAYLTRAYRRKNVDRLKSNVVIRVSKAGVSSC